MHNARHSSVRSEHRGEPGLLEEHLLTLGWFEKSSCIN